MMKLTSQDFKDIKGLYDALDDAGFRVEDVLSIRWTPTGVEATIRPSRPGQPRKTVNYVRAE